MHGSRQRDGWTLLTVPLWITCVLIWDASAGLADQRIMGALTWMLLVFMLWREQGHVRLQVTVAVGFALLMELAGTAVLQAYEYRLGNLPSYVPPGHGLVYFAAFAGARTAFVHQHIRAIRWSAIGICGAWSLWGAFWSERPDLLGACLFLVFAACMFVWKSPGVYALAFALTTHLELLGTALGNWTWAEQAGWLSAGNPPSAVVAGYCVIDGVALAGGGALASWALQRQWTVRRYYAHGSAALSELGVEPVRHPALESDG